MGVPRVGPAPVAAQLNHAAHASFHMMELQWMPIARGELNRLRPVDALSLQRLISLVLTGGYTAAPARTADPLTGGRVAVSGNGQ